VNDAVENRFEFGKQHFFADAAMIEKHHGLDHLRFVLGLHTFLPAPDTRCHLPAYSA
jgi:hypothetical protein